MTEWPSIPLGQLCSITGGGTPDRTTSAFYGGSIPWVTPKDMKRWELDSAQESITEAALQASAAKLISPNSVLVVVRSGVLKHSLPIALNRVPVAINQDMKALSCRGQLDPRYVAYFLRAQSPTILGWVRGTTADNIPVEKLQKLPVPVPPLTDQRRIADILDKADALRANRRAAVVQLDTLTQSIFLEMFGDPIANPRRWRLQPFVNLLAAPLRNGLSPSKGGAVSAKVLTLSAVTSDSFDPKAVKIGTFRSTPPQEQSVNEADLLICRGNGNVELVGKGYFAAQAMPDVTFPDTIIAARIDVTLTDRRFLEHLWNSPLVRRQIEAAARTTNGTLKVNQAALEAIRLLSPPLTLQAEFGARVFEVERLKRLQRQGLHASDALFASLQHRAFRGEL